MKTVDETYLDGSERPSVRVLLAYDNARSCGAILDMLARISARLREKTLFNVNAFKFGLLERMDTLQCPSPDAEAELAVVVFGQDGVPGAGLLRWLEIWASRHAGKNAALSLFLRGNAASESARRIVQTLKEMAARHGLSFICDAEARHELAQEPRAATAVNAGGVIPLVQAAGWKA